MHVNWTIKYFVSSIIHALLIIHWQISLANGNHVIQDRENEACNPASSFPAETCMDARNFGHSWCQCTPIQPSACLDPGEREGVWGRGVGEGCMEGVTRIPDMQLAFVVAGFYRFSWHLVFIMSGLLHGDVFLTSWRLKQPREIIESDHKPRVIAFSNWSLGIIHKEIQKKCMFSRVSGNQIKTCLLHLYMNVSSKH